MYIVHLATEVSPLAKVGGLGDVTAGLSKALTLEGERVEVILPFYDHIDKKLLKNLKIDLEDEAFEAWSANLNGVSLVLIAPKDKSFKRGVIYGEEDDLFRFTSFSKMALEYLLKKEKHPDILNLHDWLTAYAAPLYHQVYKTRELKIGGIMTTIHNMKYQGVCTPEELELSDLKKIKDTQDPEKVNLLKGAIVYSDALTTVSPTYAKEIQGKEGFGLGPLLIERKRDLRGILNGIDTTYWNPETDPHLKKNYPANGTSLEEVQHAKRKNCKALQKKLKMEFNSSPLFISVTRLVEQKGPEMIHFGIEHVLSKGGQFILLGSTPEPKAKEKFLSLADKYKDNPNVHFHFVFDEALAHLTFAAADSILIPSLFEPCGLTQMIALRYGTIPIVHKVGGLSDTIFDIDNEDIPLKKRNGYTFDSPTNEALQISIDRAFEHHNQEKWLLMMKNGLKKDWSWKAPALEYLKAYKEIC